jgi:hypothetical protein
MTSWILRYASLVLCITTFLFLGCQKEAEKQDASKGTELQNVQTETAKKEIVNREELNRELWNAVINKDIGKARSILEKGADVNIQDNEGKTPLMAAALYGRADIVKLFIESGADVNARTKSNTALQECYKFRHYCSWPLLWRKECKTEGVDSFHKGRRSIVHY